MMKTNGTPQKELTKAGLVLIFLRGSKRWFALAAMFTSLVSLLELLNPQIIRFTVDSVLGGKEPDSGGLLAVLPELMGGTEFIREHLWAAACAVLAVSAASLLCRYLFQLTEAVGAETLVETMRNSLFGHIQRLPFAWHMAHQTGDIIQRCTSDVDMVKRFLSEQLTGIFRIVILIVLSLCFMFGMNAPLAALASIVIPLVVGSSVIFHRKIASKFLECDENEGKLSTIVQENLTGVRVIRAFGREQYEVAKFDAQNRYYVSLWVRLGRILSLFWVTGDLIAVLQVLLLLVCGSVFAIRGELTAGEFIAFLSYNGMLMFPIRHLGRMISELSKAGISLNRIREIMASPEEADPPDALTPPLDGDIVFDHVSFGYDGCPELLHDVSFTVPSGTVFGILGGTGSGKSTLMHLLCRLYDLKPGCGSISIGGVDITKIRRDHLRKNVGIVLQEPFLFSRTITENIGITVPGISIDAVRAAARTACVEDAVDRFKDGFDTKVGERGVTLSGGQKQRTAIARLLVGYSPVMIFDDSLSAVDAETDVKIRRALKHDFEGRTVILISHRIATLMEADRILVLSNGRIVETGTHDELMRRNGIYRKNYELQMKSPEDEDNVPSAPQSPEVCHE
jgi:ATP-binding cassette subfamily B protein